VAVCRYGLSALNVVPGCCVLLAPHVSSKDGWGQCDLLNCLLLSDKCCIDTFLTRAMMGEWVKCFNLRIPKMDLGFAECSLTHALALMVMVCTLMVAVLAETFCTMIYP